MRRRARPLGTLLALVALGAPGSAPSQSARPDAAPATRAEARAPAAGAGAGPIRLEAGPPPAGGDRFEDAMVRGPSVAERLAEIRRRVQAAVVYPPLARRRGLSGVTRVRFEIDARGRAIELAVSRTSGHWILDRAAEHGVRRAGRLPYVYGRLEIPVRFSLADAR